MDGVAFFFDTPTDNHTSVENGVELCEMTDRKCGQKVVTECKILAKKIPSSQKHTHMRIDTLVHFTKWNWNIFQWDCIFGFCSTSFANGM